MKRRDALKTGLVALFTPAWLWGTKETEADKFAPGLVKYWWVGKTQAWHDPRNWSAKRDGIGGYGVPGPGVAAMLVAGRGCDRVAYDRRFAADIGHIYIGDGMTLNLLTDATFNGDATLGACEVNAREPISSHYGDWSFKAPNTEMPDTERYAVDPQVGWVSVEE